MLHTVSEVAYVLKLFGLVGGRSVCTKSLCFTVL